MIALMTLVCQCPPERFQLGMSRFDRWLYSAEGKVRAAQKTEATPKGTAGFRGIE